MIGRSQVGSYDDFYDALDEHHAGDGVDVKVLRAGKFVTARVTLITVGMPLEGRGLSVRRMRRVRIHAPRLNARRLVSTPTRFMAQTERSTWQFAIRRGGSARGRASSSRRLGSAMNQPGAVTPSARR
jgi:hypothetical protein